MRRLVFRWRRSWRARGEIEQLAAEVEADRLQLRWMRERLTLCRRDIAKLIEVAIEEAMPGDWETIHEHFKSLVLSIPRVETIQNLASVAEELELLREEIANELEIRMKTQESSGNPDQTERHIQNSKPDSIYELEPSP
jgi:replication initiation protein RepC